MPVQGPCLEILVFEVGGQRYGVPASEVRQLTRAATLTPLPRASSVIEGVINLRGTVTPILDIRSRFGLPPKPMEHSDHFVVIQVGERLAAVRVDRATELIRVGAEHIEDACTAVPGVEFVGWVAKLPDGLVLVLDLGRILSRAEATELEEMLPPAPNGGQP